MMATASPLGGGGAGAGAGPVVVVAHSLGTVIAYDCLKRVGDCPSVDGLLTIGSPLGLSEVQDKLAPEYSKQDGFPAKLLGPWVNVYDPLDPVAGFDPAIADEYRQEGTSLIEDINEPNQGAWRHSIVKYLRGPRLRDRLTQLLGIG
jgi:pimeloyl-ACP methyl ester carboxylesterase